MAYPAGFKYTKDHEWIELSGTQGKVGITDYAQQQLGDVVYLELPDVGTTVKAGESFGVDGNFMITTSLITAVPWSKCVGSATKRTASRAWSSSMLPTATLKPAAW